MRIPFTKKEIFVRNQEAVTRGQSVERILSDPALMMHSRSKPMLLSTVYRCVDLISDSVAVLPLETYLLDADGFKKPHKEHPAYDLLDLEPNENMTRFTFFKTMMSSVLLTGNGYAYIERDNSLNPAQLIYIPSGQVSVVWIMDENGVRRKRYAVSSLDYKFTQLVEPRDMIHILNFSYDGIIGVSTLSHAAQTLGIASDSESHAAGFFKSGGNVGGILSVEGVRLKDDQKEQIYSTWENRTNPATGRPNGIVVLEGNQKYQPISISPKDSQLLESRQFNVVDICRFFSVSPVKAFDLSKSSYSTVEASQLAYLTDTAAAIITKIELEINRKVFLPSERGKVKAEFNTSAILRTDKSAQATYLREMFNIGAITPNEIRRENNHTRLEGGDNAFVQVNVQPLERAATGVHIAPVKEN
ncbi:MAG: phage portal protein [Tannerellaceae bacterium]|jgi:HK97 family phage portal protein|nr:phage portal protein [Tannerellaceae bacterium]